MNALLLLYLQFSALGACNPGLISCLQQVFLGNFKEHLVAVKTVRNSASDGDKRTFFTRVDLDCH